MPIKHTEDKIVINNSKLIQLKVLTLMSNVHDIEKFTCVRNFIRITDDKGISTAYNNTDYLCPKLNYMDTFYG